MLSGLARAGMLIAMYLCLQLHGRFRWIDPSELPSPTETPWALDRFDDNTDGTITCAEATANGIAPVWFDDAAWSFLPDHEKIDTPVACHDQEDR